MARSTCATLERGALARVAAVAATAGVLVVVAVPVAVDVPWYANAALSCALSCSVGLFAWGVAFVVQTKQRLALLERALQERETDR